MRKLLFLLLFAVPVFAQDSIYVRINSDAGVDYLYSTDDELLEQYLASKYDTSASNFHTDFIDQVEIPGDSEQLKETFGKYRLRVWEIKTKQKEKLKKVEASKIKKWKKRK
jgi:hypothetical protein